MLTTFWNLNDECVTYLSLNNMKNDNKVSKSFFRIYFARAAWSIPSLPSPTFSPNNPQVMQILTLTSQVTCRCCSVTHTHTHTHNCVTCVLAQILPLNTLQTLQLMVNWLVKTETSDFQNFTRFFFCQAPNVEGCPVIKRPKMYYWNCISTVEQPIRSSRIALNMLNHWKSWKWNWPTGAEGEEESGSPSATETHW